MISKFYRHYYNFNRVLRKLHNLNQNKRDIMSDPRGYTTLNNFKPQSQSNILLNLIPNSTQNTSTKQAITSRRSSMSTLSKNRNPTLSQQEINAIESAKSGFKRLMEKPVPSKRVSGVKEEVFKMTGSNMMINNAESYVGTSRMEERADSSSNLMNGNKPEQKKNGKQQVKSQPNIIDAILAKKAQTTPQSFFKSLLATTVNTSANNSHNNSSYFKDKLIRVQSKRDSSTTDSTNPEETSLWIGEVFDKCTSSAFKHYISHDLDYNEAKTYCCEQILSNLLQELRQRKLCQMPNSTRLSHKDSVAFMEQSIRRSQPRTLPYITQPMQYLNQHSTKILTHLCNKYPQTNAQGINKQVAQLLSSMDIDNWANDQYDLLRLSGIKFAYKESGDYSQEIMKFMNFLIELPGRKHGKYETWSNYGFFQGVMMRILGVVYKKDHENDMEGIFLPSGQLNLQPKTRNKLSQQQQQYQQKVKKYTTIQIGCKIPSTSRPFGKEDIESGIIKVDNNAIARIIDKWAEELGSKFSEAERNILERTYRFKSADGEKFYKLSKDNRKDLFKILQKNKKQIQQFASQIKDSMYDLANKLAQNAGQDVKDLTFISESERVLGQFAVKMADSNSEYFIQILQKQIGLLLKSVEELKEGWLAKYNFKESPFYELLNINLVTFKIGDLFRCKIISNENQIARVLKVFMSLSQMWDSNLINIIRVKNRLESGTRDVLINFMFDGICPCEIQLAVAEKIEEKQAYFDKFNHFLYELKRAYLGPVMQMCKIWRQYQGKSQTYAKTIQKSIKNRIKRKHISQVVRQFDLKSNPNIVEYKLPFICISCGIFYPRCQMLYFNAIIGNGVVCGNCTKVKMGLISQVEVTETKKRFVFGKYVLRYPNFHKIVGMLQELTSIQEISEHRFQIHIPIKSRLIHMSFIMVLKLDEHTDIEHQQNQYDQYAFLETRISPEGVIQKLICSQKIARPSKDTSSLRSIRSTAQVNEIFSDDYMFYGWGAPTELVSLPQDQNGNGDCLEMIEGLLPALRRYQQNESNPEVKICAIKMPDNGYYFLPLFVVEEQKMKAQVIKQNNINYITTTLNKKSQILVLQNKKVTSQWSQLPPNIKLRLAYTIKQIYLNSNKIRRANFIQNLHTLRVFQANYNLLESLPEIPVQLEEMELYKNQIKVINGFAGKEEFIGQYKLRVLSLAWNPVEKIQNVGHLTNLKFLSLMRCKISKMQNFPPNIQILALSMNQITKIQNIQHLTQLKKMSVMGNKITKIENLQNCRALQVLMLSKNNITRIENLQELENLNILYLGSTGLSTIAHQQKCTNYLGLRTLKKLKKLILQSNKIECLFQISGFTPEDLTSKTLLSQCFIQMQQINMKDNNIQGIWGLEKIMPYASVINVQRNGIRDVSNIGDMGLLTEFYGGWNRIQSISNVRWEALFRLKVLDLSNNEIAVVPDLSALVVVKYINFQGNKITQVNTLPAFSCTESSVNRTINLKNNYLFTQQTPPQHFSITFTTLSNISRDFIVCLLQNGRCLKKVNQMWKMKEELGLDGMEVEEIVLTGIFN